MAPKRTLNQADVDFLKKTFTTKADLKIFATKTDLDKFATKFDLNRALEKQEEKYEAKVTEFKSTFFKKIDPILKEVITKREERTIQADQIKRHEDRIEALEKCCPQNGHLVAPI